MLFRAGARAISTKDLERWLSNAFVPIEPSEVFIKKLRARLIRYHGKQPFSVWMIVGAFAMALMLVLTWFGVALRIILLVLSLLGLMDRRRRGRGAEAITVSSAVEI
jgi:hypothetical protein